MPAARDGRILTGSYTVAPGTASTSTVVGYTYIDGNTGRQRLLGLPAGLDGSLTPIPGSTVTVPDGSGLGDVFFNAFGDHLVGTRTGTSEIDSFVVLPGGHLLAAKGSPFTGQGLGQIGAEFSPARPAELLVSNAHNGAGLGTVSAYRDSLSGQLTPVGASPYADGQTAPCWEISHDGRYLFAVNTGSGNISSYAINSDGSLTLIGSTPISGGGADIDARLSPDGSYLLIDGSGNHILPVFAVNGGTLTEVPSSPTSLPAGASTAGIVKTWPAGSRTNPVDYTNSGSSLTKAPVASASARASVP